MAQISATTPIERGTTIVPRKPKAVVAYRYVPGEGPPATTHLIVFLNGLVIPQAGWVPSLMLYQQKCKESRTSYPSLLCYDRYGQGESARDPSDEGNENGHDLAEVVLDLYALVQDISQQKGIHSRAGSDIPHLIFVANSIGCVLGRLFAQTYPGAVSGILMLDSNVANSDIVSTFPDPDAQGFDESKLPEGVTADDLREARAKFRAVFHPSVKNKEGLDRRNIADLLPYSDKPLLQGPDGQGPWLTVCGHDPVTFAEEGLTGPLKTPKAITNAYMNPSWNEYNADLVKTTSPGRGEGPVIARGCGHFIQRDDPNFVADQIIKLLGRIV